MELTEFFNPYNVDHIQAYKVLGETGTWPKAGHVMGIPVP